MSGEGFVDARFIRSHSSFRTENVFHIINFRDYVMSADDWLPAVGTLPSIFHNFLRRAVNPNIYCIPNTICVFGCAQLL